MNHAHSALRSVRYSRIVKRNCCFILITLCELLQLNYCIDFEFQLLKLPKEACDVDSLDALDFAEIDTENKLPWSLPVTFSPPPCLSKYAVSKGNERNTLQEESGSYRIYAPGSLATSALSCLEPLSTRMSGLSVRLDPEHHI